jgi:hypothetical protein
MKVTNMKGKYINLPIFTDTPARADSAAISIATERYIAHAKGFVIP